MYIYYVAAWRAFTVFGWRLCWYEIDRDGKICDSTSTDPNHLHSKEGLRWIEASRVEVDNSGPNQAYICIATWVINASICCCIKLKWTWTVRTRQGIAVENALVRIGKNKIVDPRLFAYIDRWYRIRNKRRPSSGFEQWLGLGVFGFHIFLKHCPTLN